MNQCPTRRRVPSRVRRRRTSSVTEPTPTRTIDALQLVSQTYVFTCAMLNGVPPLVALTMFPQVDVVEVGDEQHLLITFFRLDESYPNLDQLVAADVVPAEMLGQIKIAVWLSATPTALGIEIDYLRLLVGAIYDEWVSSHSAAN